jgi:PIN domain nuclease of toxin-antitoxin system
VLDASALLCLLQEEKGAERVAHALPAAEIGAVNYCEVVGKLVDAGMEGETADRLIDTLHLSVIPFNRTQARLAGSLRALTRLSLGDRACLALAQAQGATALTCERGWTRFQAPCGVETVR